MYIQLFSKNGKSGIAAGSNSLTPDKLAAFIITAAATVAVYAIGGLFGLSSTAKKSRKSLKTRPMGERAKQKKHKKMLPVALAPLVFKAVKTGISNKSLSSIVSQVTAGNSQRESEVEMPSDDEIELIDAIPIGSEEEVYQHV